MPDLPETPTPSADPLADLGAVGVLRRGVQATPELLDGLRITAGLGVVAAIGQIAAPIVIQQAIERGLSLIHI